jgi:hypothetical protein
MSGYMMVLLLLLKERKKGEYRITPQIMRESAFLAYIVSTEKETAC